MPQQSAINRSIWGFASTADARPRNFVSRSASLIGRSTLPIACSTKLVHGPAVFQPDRDARLVLVQAGSTCRIHSVAQRDHLRIANARVAVLGLAGGAVDERDRRGMIDAELAFEADLRRFLAGQLEDQRMHLRLDGLDLVDLESVFRAELNAARR